MSKKDVLAVDVLINHQKAEIEELREIVFMDRSEAIKQLRAEAVKEFAERLKSELTPYPDVTFREYVSSLTIDNLVKEFTEGEKP